MNVPYTLGALTREVSGISYVPTPSEQKRVKGVVAMLGPKLSSNLYVCQTHGVCDGSTHTVAPKPVLPLQNTYAGAVFLICGGPSLQDTDLSFERGHVVAAVNQVAATHIRPHLWFSVDCPSRFHQSIWKDATILKFTKKRYEATRVNNRPVTAYPNTWLYNHSSGFNPATFLTQPRPTWGTDDRTAVNGQVARSVMLIALRLLHWIGFRTVYLVGCDFDAYGKPYAFDVEPGSYDVQGNATVYKVVNKWMHDLKPVFDDAGFNVFNCTPGSRLDAFEYVHLEDAKTQHRLTVDSVKELYR